MEMELEMNGAVCVCVCVYLGIDGGVGATDGGAMDVVFESCCPCRVHERCSRKIDFIFHFNRTLKFKVIDILCASLVHVERCGASRMNERKKMGKSCWRRCRFYLRRCGLWMWRNSSERYLSVSQPVS